MHGPLGCMEGIVFSGEEITVVAVIGSSVRCRWYVTEFL